jgi:tRNA(Ile)-lysidine synthase
MYPKATPSGGVLVRRVIQTIDRVPGFLRRADSHILIALSGGSDSTALAHLLIHYGRNIVKKEKIHLLHIDHGWRKESARDAQTVKRWAEMWGVSCVIRKMPAQFRPAAARRAGGSVEAFAREGRKKIFSEVAKKVGAKWVLTAHTADDVAETFLWRIASGQGALHAGIALQHGIEIRPFLDVWKSEIVNYLQEVKQPWLEDPSNFESHLLRARIRQTCWPALEQVFPQIKKHFFKRATRARRLPIDMTMGPC